MQGTTFTRRSLAKGALWSLPVIAVSSAAPALAASAMPVTMLWSDFPRRSVSGRLTNSATQTVAGVSVTTSLARPALAHANNNWEPTSDGRLEMASNRLTTGDGEQIVTLEFAAPVSNVSLTIEDLDRGRSPDHEDEVYIPAGGTPFTTASPGRKVIGSGTPSAPFRAADDVLGDFSGPDYAVSFTWAGPISSIQIGYRQGVQAHLGAYPTIWISPVTFTPSLSA